MNGNQTLPVSNPPSRPFRRAVWRGLAVLTPPLLTVLIILWAINTTKSYLLEPVTGWAREVLVWSMADVRKDLETDSPDGRTAAVDGQLFHRLRDDSYIPEEVYARVRQNPGTPPPITGEGYYRRYVDITMLRPHVAIPLFLALFILFLYFLGKFMAAGFGDLIGGAFDRIMLRLPGVRGVYSSVKQVSDFVFTQRDFKYTRIVAVEYPRRDMWSIGFVTSERFAKIRDRFGEPVVTLFIPYSPVPVTGCTVVVPSGDCIDLNITFDQACQFIFSCGVVVPPPLALEENKEQAAKKTSVERSPRE